MTDKKRNLIFSVYGIWCIPFSRVYGHQAHDEE